MALPLNIALREWFDRQDKYRTYKEFAAAVGVNYNTLRKYFAGNAFPNEADRRKLYEATHLESLSGELRSVDSLSETELGELAKRIRDNLYDIYDALQPFVDSSSDERDFLRQQLNFPDVGHITGLLRALASEERFQTWLKMNSYKPRR